MFKIDTWDLEHINKFMVLNKTNKPADYVSSELTQFVLPHVKAVNFVRVSPKTTVCVLTMQNGYEVIGTSACINPAAYRDDIGSKYALHVAVDKASELVAYVEQTKCSNFEEYSTDTPA